MTTRSDIVLWLLLLGCGGTLASPCEINSSSIFEASSCLSCGGCYDLMESHYNRSLELHANLTIIYEHLLNLSQLNISQLVDDYLAMLMISYNLAVKTTESEGNLTSELSEIARAATEANELLDMLKRNLSSAINGSRVARATHNNSVALLEELNIRINSIDNIIHNIMIESNRTMSIYSQILTKLEMLDNVANDTRNASRWQENLAMAAKLTAEEAHNISSVALVTLCQAIELHNATTDLVRQLKSQNAINVTTLQQQINAIVMVIQQVLSEHSVFNTSQQLIDEAANISIPSYDVTAVESMVNDALQNVSEVFTGATSSLKQLEMLKGQGSDLNDTVEELLKTGRDLKEQADVLFKTLNESFFRTKENISAAELYFNDITVLHANLSMLSDEFNDLFAKLEEEDVENVTLLARGLSIDAQEGLQGIQQLLTSSNESLDNSTSQLTRDKKVLNETLHQLEKDEGDIRSDRQLIEQVQEKTDDEWRNIFEVNEIATKQSSELTNLNSAALSTQKELDLIEQNLTKVRNQLGNLTKKLENLEFPGADLETVKKKVQMANTVVQNNEKSLSGVVKKMADLKESSDELDEKYKQLKQHRDLLRQILNNIGDNSCD